jgi:hypothetical protein
MTEPDRELAVTSRTRVFEFKIGAPDKFVAHGDGGLLVRDALALASGIWTDSATKAPCFFSEAVLKRDFMNWLGTGVWSRHPGGVPRNIDEMTGSITNPRYSAAEKGVLVDILYHGRNQHSRDTIEMIKAGVTNDISVEVGGEDKWNADAKRYDAVSLAFYGLANVDKGACDVCKLKRNEACTDHESQAGTKEMEGEPTMSDETTKDLETKLAALESEKAELMKKLAASEDNFKALGEAHTKEMSELTTKLDASGARVKELENMAAPPKTLSGSTRELEGDSGGLPIPEMRIVYRNGEVKRI